jgi:hypothetical protein
MAPTRWGVDPGLPGRLPRAAGAVEAEISAAISTSPAWRPPSRNGRHSRGGADGRCRRSGRLRPATTPPDRRRHPQRQPGLAAFVDEGQVAAEGGHHPHAQCQVKADYWEIFDDIDAEPGTAAMAVARSRAKSFASRWRKFTQRRGWGGVQQTIASIRLLAEIRGDLFKPDAIPSTIPTSKPAQPPRKVNNKEPSSTAFYTKLGMPPRRPRT